jgi:hypothetical protein
MLQVLRSRCLSLATLAAFLFVQPAALCAALCVFERHHAAMHAMGGTDHGTTTLAGAGCHDGVTGAAQHDETQVISPMAPTRAVVIAAAPERRAEPGQAHPTLPRPLFRAADPPPPRVV